MYTRQAKFVIDVTAQAKVLLSNFEKLEAINKAKGEIHKGIAAIAAKLKNENLSLKEKSEIETAAKEHLSKLDALNSEWEKLKNEADNIISSVKNINLQFQAVPVVNHNDYQAAKNLNATCDTLASKTKEIVTEITTYIPKAQSILRNKVLAQVAGPDQRLIPAPRKQEDKPMKDAAQQQANQIIAGK